MANNGCFVYRDLFSTVISFILLPSVQFSQHFPNFSGTHFYNTRKKQGLNIKGIITKCSEQPHNAKDNGSKSDFFSVMLASNSGDAHPIYGHLPALQNIYR